MKLNILNKRLLKFYSAIGFALFMTGIIITSGTYPGKLNFVIFNNFWFVLYAIVVNFILFEYSIPFVIGKGKAIFIRVLAGVLLFILHMMLYSYGLYAWRLFGIQLHFYNELKIYSSLNVALENLMTYSVGSFFYFGISRHVYAYIELKQSAQQLRIEKQEAELNYLKSQTNPHFLFNTLNNIYSLARTKSDLAPESILRLSKILRFMLYETGRAYISIEQELKLIHDYIALERLRYDVTLTIKFKSSIEDPKLEIPPLLLIPLVENAFKHGVSETRSKPYVDIYLTVHDKKLELSIKNSTEPFYGDPTVKEHIGLSNLRRQLELLYTDYSLTVQQGEFDFKSVLKINLQSHV